MKFPVYISCILLLLACSPRQEAPADAVVKPIVSKTSIEETAQLTAWLDEEFSDYLDYSPLSKTRLGDKSDYDKLDDVSDAARDKKLAWRRASVSRMKALFDRENLTIDGKLSWDLWSYLLEREEQGVPFRRHEYIFGRRGPHTGLPNSLINNHKVDSLGDFVAYVARLNQFPRYLGQYLEREPNLQRRRVFARLVLTMILRSVRLSESSKVRLFRREIHPHSGQISPPNSLC